MDFWYVLGIEPTKDEKTIKNAYRKQLKVCHPEDDPEGFKALRAAYDSAVKYASEPDADEKTEEIDDEWIAKINDIYTHYSKRIKLDQWKALLESDDLFCIDTEIESRDKLLGYLMNHHLIPGKVWKLIVDRFEIKDNLKEFKERFPENFLEYIINNAEYPDNFAYDMFEQQDDSLPYDDYINEYFHLRSLLGEREIDKIKSVIAVMDRMPLSHPYYRSSKMNYCILTDQMDVADEISKELYENYYDDHNCRMSRAYFLYHKGEYQQAADIYETLTKSELVNYPSRCGLADCLLELRHYKEAQKLYKELLMDKHYDAYVHYRLTLCNEELVKSYKEAVKADPSDDTSRIELCWCYYQNSDLKSAYSLIKNINRDTPVNMDYSYLKGRCLLGMQKKSVAKKHFLNWISEFEINRNLEGEIGKRNREREELVYYFLGEIAIQNKKFDEALDYNEKATKCMQIDKDLIVTQRGVIYKKMGMLREAVDKLEEALSISYDNIQTMVALGDCYKEAGILSEAIGYYERAMYTYGCLPEVEAKICRIYIDEGLMDKAEDMIKDFKTREYRSAAHLFVQALYYRENDEIIPAAEIIEEINALDIHSLECDLLSFTDEEDYLYESVSILYDAKKISADETISTMKMVVKKAPDNVNYLYYLANLCYRHMDDKAAILYFKKALKLRPGNREILLALASVYREGGSNNEAKTLKAVLEQYPDDNVANGRLGDFYDKKQLFNTAIKYYSKQLEVDPSDYYFISRGIDYLELEKYDEAMADFMEARSINEENPYSYYNIGRLLMRQKKFADAIEPLKTAIKVAGKEKRHIFYNLLAKCYVRQRDSIKKADEKIRKLYADMRKAFPDDPAVLINEAKALRGMGLWREAIEILDSAIDMEDSHKYNIEQEIVITVLDATLDRTEVDRYVDKYVDRLSPKDASNLWYYYAKYFGDLENEHKYITLNSPQSDREYYDAALSCYKLAQKKKGAGKKKLMESYEQYLDKADRMADGMLAYASDKLQGLRRKAMIALQRDDFEQTERILERAEHAPMCDYCFCKECYELYTVKALLYMKKGDKQEALKCIEHAAALCPDDGEIELLRRKINEM